MVRMVRGKIGEGLDQGQCQRIISEENRGLDKYRNR